MPIPTRTTACKTITTGADRSVAELRLIFERASNPSPASTTAESDSDSDVASDVAATEIEINGTAPEKDMAHQHDAIDILNELVRVEAMLEFIKRAPEVSTAQTSAQVHADAGDDVTENRDDEDCRSACELEDNQHVEESANASTSKIELEAGSEYGANVEPESKLEDDKEDEEATPNEAKDDKGVKIHEVGLEAKDESEEEENNEIEHEAEDKSESKSEYQLESVNVLTALVANSIGIWTEDEY
ncbi:hypothetical protein PINS_up000044 [Pythium insidiosum]|nr:hypothetical protein PINS_up000044 [Pythium insidiosum]